MSVRGGAATVRNLRCCAGYCRVRLPQTGPPFQLQNSLAALCPFYIFGNVISTSVFIENLDADNHQQKSDTCITGFAPEVL
jgi:hypothetical protein